MNESQKTLVLNSLAGLVLVATVAGTIIYNNYLSPILHDKTVLVASKTLQTNQVLDATDFKSVMVPTSLLEPGVVTSASQVSGMMSAQVITANQQITQNDLEANTLTPKANQEITPISPNWIYSVPDSLRRGDTVDIYVYPKPQLGQTMQPSQLTKNATKGPLLKNVTVEYVHNNNNQEVTNAPGPVDNGGPLSLRENGTANPDLLELLLTPSQIVTLQNLSITNQFIFTYSAR